ncbi:MAG: heterodisulfide reductase subunit C [Planctomycetes bacterium]|nr:heterodisulfide reductase subunit C [Planctomycetota bacterium]
MNPIAIDASFGKEIHEACGQNVNLCFQCFKCTAGCPIVEDMDLTPTQVIHAIRLGDRNAVLNSKTIWLCASCETCTTRCPQEVDIAKVMDGARSVALKSGRVPAIPEAVAFYKSMLLTMRMCGRVYEAGMMGLLKLRTREFTKDSDLATQLVLHGKLKFLPPLSSIVTTNRIFARAKQLESASPLESAPGGKRRESVEA